LGWFASLWLVLTPFTVRKSIAFPTARDTFPISTYEVTVTEVIDKVLFLVILIVFICQAKT